jgi:hypothetical protein
VPSLLRLSLCQVPLIMVRFAAVTVARIMILSLLIPFKQEDSDGFGSRSKHDWSPTRCSVISNSKIGRECANCRNGHRVENRNPQKVDV